MRVVIALGGNALQRRDEPADLEHRRRNLGTAARALAEVAQRDEVVVTHCNGPWWAGWPCRRAWPAALILWTC